MEELTRNGVVFRLIQGDITRVSADAIVNAANTSLLGGSGVDGAIHRVGGSAILAECRLLGRCPTGEARITTAGNLPARYVIHTVGPVWRGGNQKEADLLAAAYRNSFDLAKEYTVTSISFPSISTGAYCYPIQQAAPIALAAADAAAQDPGALREIMFVLYSSDAFEVYEQALVSLAS